jgi:hypothetical protein
MGRTRRRWLLGLAFGLVLIGGAGSCDENGLGDAPVGNRSEAPRGVIVMPDKFANVAVVCDGPARIYVTTRDAAPVVVMDHPACANAGELGEG